MSMQKGSELLLKVGDGDNPEQYLALGGLNIVSFTLNNEGVQSNTIDSGDWVVLNSNNGLKSLSISASGFFTDENSETILRINAFSNTTNNYQLEFANGDLIEGAFKVSNYSKSGDVNLEESYSVTLSSAGELQFISA